MNNYQNKLEQDNEYLSGYANEERYLNAKKKVDKIIGFYWHLAWYVIVNIVLIGIIAANTQDIQDIFNFGTFSTAFFWGIGLFIHWMGVFGPNLIMGKNWEQKKIKQIMDKDKALWE